MDKTFILNFGHPLAPKVLEELQPCEEIMVGYSSYPFEDPERRVRDVVDKASRMIKEKGGVLNGTVPLFLVLPTISEGAALIVAEMAGRIGFLPRLLPLRRGRDGVYGLLSYRDSGKTVNVEYIDLQRVKLGARGRRGREKSGGEQEEDKK